MAALIDHRPDGMTVHQTCWLQDLMDKFDMKIDVVCYQVVRYDKTLLPIGMPGNMEIRPVTPDMYDDVVKGTFLLTGGYHTLTPAEVHEILVESE